MSNNDGPRRRKGEGTIGRLHNHPTCPPAGPDRVRPEHDCQGLYRAQLWVTSANGERIRKTVYGKTEREVVTERNRLLVAENQRTVVRTKGMPTVEEWLRTRVTEVRDGEEVEVPVEDAGISNWWTRAKPELKASTRKGYASKIHRYIIPVLGKHRLDKLTPGHVQELFAVMRKEGLAEGSLRQTHAILRRALTVAVREGKISRNVCGRDFLDAPKTKAKRRQGLTVGDALRVLRAAGDNPRHWVSLFTGIRQGEALALRWYDVHLLNEAGVCVTCGEAHPMPFLVTREAVYREPGVGIVFDTPKSEESTDRVVPLITPVAARLAVHRAKAFAAGGTDADLVFPNPRTGKVMDARADWQTWATLLEVAGVEHVALHAARNTTAHLLENAGVPERIVMEILGHANVAMTRHYQGGNAVAAIEAMRALEAYLSENDGDAA